MELFPMMIWLLRSMNYNNRFWKIVKQKYMIFM